MVLEEHQEEARGEREKDTPSRRPRMSKYEVTEKGMAPLGNVNSPVERV